MPSSPIPISVIPIRRHSSVRHDRPRHRQFLHGDVLFPVGIICLAGHCSQGTAEPFVRPPVSALACHSSSVHSRSFRSPTTPFLCGTIRRQLRFILVEDHHRSDPGRADRSGFFGSCSASTWLLASCTRCRPTFLDPINRLSLHGRRRPAISYAVMLRSPLRSTFRGGSTSEGRQLVGVRAFLGPARPRDALRYLLLLSAPGIAFK